MRCLWGLNRYWSHSLRKLGFAGAVDFFLKRLLGAAQLGGAHAGLYFSEEPLAPEDLRFERLFGFLDVNGRGWHSGADGWCSLYIFVVRLAASCWLWHDAVRKHVSLGFVASAVGRGWPPLDAHDEANEHQDHENDACHAHEAVVISRVVVIIAIMLVWSGGSIVYHAARTSSFHLYTGRGVGGSLNHCSTTKTTAAGTSNRMHRAIVQGMTLAVDRGLYTVGEKKLIESPLGGGEFASGLNPDASGGSATTNLPSPRGVGVTGGNRTQGAGPVGVAEPNRVFGVGHGPRGAYTDGGGASVRGAAGGRLSWAKRGLF